MRLAAYKKAMDEAFELPAFIPELQSYFDQGYSPRQAAAYHILRIARADEKSLFDGEFVELYNYMRKKMDELPNVQQS